jgi:hypothetical protein
LSKCGYLTTELLAVYLFGAVDRSKITMAGKWLNQVDCDKLKYGKGHIYRLKGLRGEGSEHTLKVSEVIVQILLKFPDSEIYREVPINKSRADLVAIIKNEGRALPLIIEVPINEFRRSIESKIIDFQNLDDLFGYQHAGVLVVGDMDIDMAGVKCGEVNIIWTK